MWHESGWSWSSNLWYVSFRSSLVNTCAPSNLVLISSIVRICVNGLSIATLIIRMSIQNLTPAPFDLGAIAGGLTHVPSSSSGTFSMTFCARSSLILLSAFSIKCYAIRRGFCTTGVLSLLIINVTCPSFNFPILPENTLLFSLVVLAISCLIASKSIGEAFSVRRTKNFLLYMRSFNTSAVFFWHQKTCQRFSGNIDGCCCWGSSGFMVSRKPLSHLEATFAPVCKELDVDFVQRYDWAVSFSLLWSCLSSIMLFVASVSGCQRMGCFDSHEGWFSIDFPDVYPADVSFIIVTVVCIGIEIFLYHLLNSFPLGVLLLLAVVETFLCGLSFFFSLRACYW